MKLSQLLQRRLIFVSGKGGVGKTSLAVLLALTAAAKNKKVLLVEMNSIGRIAPIFNSYQNIQQTEIELTQQISLINLSPELCFKEYAVKLLHFARLYKTFFTNRYVSNFINAVPGLDEFMMMTKIDQLECKFKNAFSSRLMYDLIIVDAPATGHGLTVLEVPEIIASAIKIGPPHKQALSIMDLLADRSRTAFCLVTLAEEMPVAESEEYIKALKERTQLGFGPIFINAVMPEPKKISLKKELPDKLKIFWDYYTLAKERYELNREHLTQIETRFSDFHQIILPFQFQGLRFHQDFDYLVNFLMETER